MVEARVSPWIVAHRGAMIEAPENTRSAFDRALSFPVDGIELDVHCTGDGIPVIFHDDTLKKINGSSRPVADHTFDQLGALDWGNWFSPAYSGERLMTLPEILASYGSRTRLMVEIKTAPKKRHAVLYRELARSAAELMRRLVADDFQNNLYILSFDPELIKIVREHDPNRRCVLNLSRPVKQVSELAIGIDELYGLCLKFSLLNQEFIAFGRRHHLKIMTYSCNTLKSIERAMDFGADVIMTDDPGSTYSYIKQSV